jgi:hypothetical protein
MRPSSREEQARGARARCLRRGRPRAGLRAVPAVRALDEAVVVVAVGVRERPRVDDVERAGHVGARGATYHARRDAIRVP